MIIVATPGSEIKPTILYTENRVHMIALNYPMINNDCSLSCL